MIVSLSLLFLFTLILLLLTLILLLLSLFIPKITLFFFKEKQCRTRICALCLYLGIAFLCLAALVFLDNHDIQSNLIFVALGLLFVFFSYRNYKSNVTKSSAHFDNNSERTNFLNTSKFVNKNNKVNANKTDASLVPPSSSVTVPDSEISVSIDLKLSDDNLTTTKFNESEKSDDDLTTTKFNELQKPDDLELNEYMMLRINPKITPHTDFPNYWMYEWHTNNPKEVVANLVERGFYISAPVKDKMSFLKLPELKAIAKSANLKVSGKKADLIDRILNTLSLEQLKPYLNLNAYILSEKGVIASSDEHLANFLLLNKIELLYYCSKLSNDFPAVIKYKNFLLSRISPAAELPVSDYSNFGSAACETYKLLIDLDRKKEALPYLVRAFWSSLNRHLDSFKYNSDLFLSRLFFTRSWLFYLLNSYENNFVVYFMNADFWNSFIDLKTSLGSDFDSIVIKELKQLEIEQQFIKNSDILRLINGVFLGTDSFRKVVEEICSSLVSEVLTSAKQNLFADDSVEHELLVAIIDMSKKLKL